MSHPIQTSERPGPVSRIVGWWRNWNRRRRNIAELDWRLARDLAVSSSELRVLAGKWPDDLLSRRLEHLDFDAAELARREPQVMRDLERVCTLCGSKRRCRHDLAENPYYSRWVEYCPNATTLSALIAERFDSRKPGRI
jgi:uncharacterized protein YjiS (DUF1127 family)